MKIILSPAKKMKVVDSNWIVPTKPALIDESKKILNYLKSLSLPELKDIWLCSDKLASKSYLELSRLNLDNLQSPAILSYDGIAYTYMAPSIFDGDMYNYINENLYILSALFGALKPSDGVMPYRLEMQAKFEFLTFNNLYDFWGDKIYKLIHPSDGIIINLASKEYSDAVRPFISSSDRFIDIIFVESVNNKLVTKATFAKMARGEMVRFMAENKIETLEELKNFDRLNFSFRSDLSTENELFFERKK